jgi:hypothetical protein
MLWYSAFQENRSMLPVQAVQAVSAPPLIPALLLFAATVIIGLGVKYIDAAYDDSAFSRSRTLPLSICLGLLAGSLMVYDADVAVLFLALITGVSVTGKVDTPPFRVLVLTTITISCFSVPLYLSTAAPCVLLAIFSVAAAIDEVGNDMADDGHLPPLLSKFFSYRGLLKTVVLVGILTHCMSDRHAYALFGFDAGYIVIALIAHNRLRQNGCSAIVAPSL